MDMRTDIDLLEMALNWTNRVRGLLGRPAAAKLAEGVPGEDWWHPLARTAGPDCCLHADQLHCYTTREVFLLSEAAREWDRRYREGRYPNLVDWDAAFSTMLTMDVLGEEFPPAEQ